ncbi:MAG TPA: ribosome biogenesis GTP-binding protein YihA/YsxC [Thermoanaerobaculia bacterium]|nr:ribosome biogenesis GTP-binding protein YihA/YsxC [Thermoanaerobaculia bacterium]
MTALGVSPERHPGTRPGQARSPLGSRVRLVLPAHRAGERPAGKPLPTAPVLGRSNVGKSSLLNALLGVKVARVSQTPGRTQALYWYRVEESFDLVDCPGYGYAKTAKEKRAEFSGMIETLLTAEPRPDAALLLVDGRLEPQSSDLSMSEFLRVNGVPTIVAFTKWDAVKPSQRVKRLRELTNAFASDASSLLPVSSETGENLRDLALLLKSSLKKESL